MDFAAPICCCSSAAAAAAAMSGAGSGVLPFRCGFESERATAPSPRLTTSRRDIWPRALAWMWVAAAYAELKCPIRSRGVVLAVNAPTGGKHWMRAFRLEGHLPRSRRRAKFWRAQRSAPHAYPSCARVDLYQVTILRLYSLNLVVQRCQIYRMNLPSRSASPSRGQNLAQCRCVLRCVPLSTVEALCRLDLDVISS